jgi:hypothetical protein
MQSALTDDVRYPTVNTTNTARIRSFGTLRKRVVDVWSVPGRNRSMEACEEGSRPSKEPKEDAVFIEHLRG